VHSGHYLSLSPSKNLLKEALLVVCKLLDLGHAGLGHAELGQHYWDTRYWDMRNWDSFYNVKMGKIVTCVLFVLYVTRLTMCCGSATGTRATRTAGLGHAELGQRYWDTHYRDIFCDTNVEKKFFCDGIQ